MWDCFRVVCAAFLFPSDHWLCADKPVEVHNVCPLQLEAQTVPTGSTLHLPGVRATPRRSLWLVPLYRCITVHIHLPRIFFRRSHGCTAHQCADKGFKTAWGGSRDPLSQSRLHQVRMCDSRSLRKHCCPVCKGAFNTMRPVAFWLYSLLLWRSNNGSFFSTSTICVSEM